MLQKISRILLIVSLTLCSFACLYLYVNPHLDDFETFPNTKTIMFVGSTLTVETEAVPFNYKHLTVKWKSSNTEIATITERGGEIKALTPGTTTITAKDTITNKQKSFELEVLPIKMFSVYVDAPFEIIHPAETMQLETTFYPQNSTYTEFNYVSSNTAVATVSNTGLITGVGEGEATIVITNTMQPEITESYQIKVQNTIECESIKASISTKDPYGLAANSTYQISYEKTPANADVDSVTYTSSNQEIATVSETGIVKPIYAGSATITVKTNNGLTSYVSIGVPYVKPRGIRIVCSGISSGFKYTLLKGGIKHLTVSYLPSNATVRPSELEWSSSDPSKVSVDANGKITALETTKQVVGGMSFNLEVTIQVRIKGLTINEYTPASIYVTVP